jgi:hypothetical protein
MDEDTLRRLYDFNISFQEDVGPDTRKRKAERRENWGGHSIRIMLLLIYIISFLCLLRFDEVLNIQWSWIKLEVYKGRNRLKLSLPFRKTHQYGGMLFFHLGRDPGNFLFTDLPHQILHHSFCTRTRKDLGYALFGPLLSGFNSTQLVLQALFSGERFTRSRSVLVLNMAWYVTMLQVHIWKPGVDLLCSLPTPSWSAFATTCWISGLTHGHMEPIRSGGVVANSWP